MITSPSFIKALAGKAGFRTGIGYASFSTLLKGVGTVWKKAVGGLKKVGINPGKLLKKGVSSL